MELFGRNRNGELVISLHDIGGHLCVQRGPRGIRQKVHTPEQAIAAGDDIGLDDETLTGLVGKYFGTAGAGAAPEGRTVLKTVANAGPGLTGHVLAFCDDGSVWRKDTDVNRLRRRLGGPDPVARLAGRPRRRAGPGDRARPDRQRNRAVGGRHLLAQRQERRGGARAGPRRPPQRRQRLRRRRGLRTLRQRTRGTGRWPAGSSSISPTPSTTSRRRRGGTRSWTPTRRCCC